MKINKTLPIHQDMNQIREEQKAKLKEASTMYEQQFMREMVRAMRSTVHKSDLLPESFGEKIFREKLDHEYVQNWGQRGGVGLADMIYSNLVDKYFPDPARTLPPPQGPMPLNSSNQGEVRMRPLKASSEEGVKNPLQIEIRPEEKDPSSPSSPEEVRAPWSGKILKKERRETGEISYLLDHGQGMRSEIQYQGLSEALSLGSEVEAGERLGQREPGSSLVWNLWS